MRMIAVPVPSLSEYMPPYCLAHSVNLGERGCQWYFGVASGGKAILQVGTLLGHLMEVPNQR